MKRLPERERERKLFSPMAKRVRRGGLNMKLREMALRNIEGESETARRRYRFVGCGLAEQPLSGQVSSRPERKATDGCKFMGGFLLLAQPTIGTFALVHFAGGVSLLGPEV